MPYYIYRVRPFAQLDCLAEHASYPEASAAAKSMRAEQADGNKARIKLIFAPSEQEAEDLLSQVRNPEPAGDD